MKPYYKLERKLQACSQGQPGSEPDIIKAYTIAIA